MEMGDPRKTHLTRAPPYEEMGNWCFLLSSLLSAKLQRVPASWPRFVVSRHRFKERENGRETSPLFATAGRRRMETESSKILNVMEMLFIVQLVPHFF